jgi:FMN reductase
MPRSGGPSARNGGYGDRSCRVKTAVVVGNPKPKSRTRDAGILAAHKLTGADPDIVLDLVDLGPALLEFGNSTVAEAIQSIQHVDVAVFASPTFKATYTGLLKLFLDQFPPDGLANVTAFPLMLGAGPAHALAPELLLKPVLVELGATCPVAGLYLIDKTFAEDPRLDAWAVRARKFIPDAEGRA